MPLWLVLVLSAHEPRLKAGPWLSPGLEAPAGAVGPSWGGGRVYTSRRLHVGVRPHATWSGNELGVAVTVQVTFASWR